MCGSSARTDLCGGRSVRAVPTATKCGLHRCPQILPGGSIARGAVAALRGGPIYARIGNRGRRKRAWDCPAASGAKAVTTRAAGRNRHPGAAANEPMGQRADARCEGGRENGRYCGVARGNRQTSGAVFPERSLSRHRFAGASAGYGLDRIESGKHIHIAGRRNTCICRRRRTDRSAGRT